VLPSLFDRRDGLTDVMMEYVTRLTHLIFRVFYLIVLEILSFRLLIFAF
jgi:hypothetical protein